LTTARDRTRTQRPTRRAQASDRQAHLFLVLNAGRLGDTPRRWRLGDVHEVVLGRASSTSASQGQAPPRITIQVNDAWMSGVHAKLVQAEDRWFLDDKGSKNGTLVNGAKRTSGEIHDGDLIEMGHTFFLFRAEEPVLAGDDWEYVPAPVHASAPLLVTLASSLREHYAALARAAASEASVVLGGETGTGKEVAARALHALSRRRGDFVGVNCAGLPPQLVESELFGHVKGAFTDAAASQRGLIRAADKGTLFLDEVADLPLAAQPKLLRVLQEREVLPLGATKPIPVDVRIVCATHGNLPELVADKRFRADLYGRLDGVHVELPPLRERREDLGLLIATLLRRIAPDRADKVVLEADAARALFRHAWPLNIRELEKALGTALLAAGERAIQLDHLPASVRDAPRPKQPAPPKGDEPADEELERELLEHLREQSGNVSAVAKAMGKDRKQIHRWLKRFDIDPATYQDD
jgi:sigma-54 dependent transcriptional regulator, acetoin dehydrogenase operon transcriptional activator AcoR